MCACVCVFSWQQRPFWSTALGDCAEGPNETPFSISLILLRSSILAAEIQYYSIIHFVCVTKFCTLYRLKLHCLWALLVMEWNSFTVLGGMLKLLCVPESWSGKNKVTNTSMQVMCLVLEMYLPVSVFVSSIYPAKESIMLAVFYLLVLGVWVVSVYEGIRVCVRLHSCTKSKRAVYHGYIDRQWKNTPWSVVQSMRGISDLVFELQCVSVDMLYFIKEKIFSFQVGSVLFCVHNHVMSWLSHCLTGLPLFSRHWINSRPYLCSNIEAHKSSMEQVL